MADLRNGALKANSCSEFQPRQEIPAYGLAALKNGAEGDLGLVRIAICPQKELTILQLISDDVVNELLDRFGIFLYCLSHNNCIFVRDNYDKLTVRTGTKNNICVG